ncbi:hypothetical protein F383_25557 [Gossypium arboreum]|uniref:Uncharacterized protein n=1 Tax=Gossypium arboreum TaxID=29729 RepID=A0A0B0P9B6_GOSAR|nr:hypothetical protein F383_25557 [Gossypium arboreum]
MFRSRTKEIIFGSEEN